MLTDSTAIVKGLEMDKFIAIIIKGVILLGALNSLSSRFFFFLIRRSWVLLIEALKYFKVIREYLF
jgi:hypothetical protein